MKGKFGLALEWEDIDLAFFRPCGQGPRRVERHKQAKAQTGLVAQVRPFINAGKMITVDSSEGATLYRA